MGSCPEICDLLEGFLDAGGMPEPWITVEEVRRFYRLDKTSSPAITGILHRLYKNRTFGYPYRVVRMEKSRETGPPYRVFTRYLVQKRPSPTRPESRPGNGRIPFPYQ